MTKLLNFLYGTVQGTYWMYYGAIMSFSSVFLLEKNYTNSEIGVILASASILAVILQPLLGNAADQSQKISLIGITGIITTGLLITTASLHLFPAKALILSVIFIMLSAWHTSLQPLINSMAFYLSRSGHPINFGIARSGGSVAYALFCAILGTLVASYGTDVIPSAGVFTMILLLISLVITGKSYKKAIMDRSIESEIQEANSGIEIIGLKDFMRRNKLFIVFTVGIVFVFFQNSIFNSYLMQIIAEVGGNSSQLGRLFSFMALLELPGLFFFSRLRTKFSCQFMLKISSVAFVLKVFFTMIAPSVAFIYAAFLFQLISFPIFLSASVYLVDEVMEKGEAVKGQSFVTGMITLSSVFASLLGGIILDLSGASLLLLVSTVLAVIGTLIVFFSIGGIKPKS